MTQQLCCDRVARWAHTSVCDRRAVRVAAHTTGVRARATDELFRDREFSIAIDFL